MPRRNPLLPLDLALESLLSALDAPLAPESVDTLQADGRVLAQEVVSALHVPPQDNSAMDGYAVRCADLGQAGAVLSVTQRIAAGESGKSLERFTAARIFTGAP
ncbi:MAG: molybdopterin molybdenumtransferase MoeA, partial [Rhodoferax sp.]